MIRRIVVVVPAADEELAIEECLAALFVAAAAVSVPVRVVVVLDACTDGTADVIALRTSVETVPSQARNVGQARRAGVEHALLDAGDPSEVWLANTDADSKVPRDWLAGMVRLADPDDPADAADVVLGTVVPDTGLLPSVERSWLAGHDQTDGHRHVHGANLGIRADAYLAIGGWRPLAAHEDDDLAARAVGAGLRIRRTAAIPVVTSSRALGRTPSGFSSYLRALGHV